jgi:thiosulfate reductase cytochrome b subunit
MNTTRYQFYSRYERIWHWCQAGVIGLLIATGLAIHAPRYFEWLSFDYAVCIHNFLGVVLIVNAFFGLFYYVSSREIHQFLPETRGFLLLAVRQGRYYLHGILRGEPHPIEKTSERRLNPLQQITYLLILNVLLPLQMVTGLLMWGAQRWPQTVQSIGGLPLLGMIHTLIAWLFSSFLLMHLYLITTGHTPLANMKTMVLGYEDVRSKEKTDEMAA